MQSRCENRRKSLQNKGKCHSGQKEYSRAIVKIEDAGVATIASALRTEFPSSCQLVEKPSFKLSGRRHISPDIVILDCYDNTLIVDVKYAVPPFGPLDVNYDIKEVDKWQKRMGEYVNALGAVPETLRQHFAWQPKGSGKIFGLILLRWPLPVPFSFGEFICAVDWPSLHDHLRRTDTHVIESIVQWARNRPDLAVPTALVWKEKTVNVSDWTYRYSVLSPSAPSK